MGYRDELEAAHARIQALEAEVAGLREESLVLAHRDTALVLHERVRYEKLSDNSYRASVALDGELAAENQPKVLRAIRKLIGGAERVEVLDKGFRWSSTNRATPLSIELRSDAGATTLAIEEKIAGQGRGALLAGGALLSLALYLPLAALYTLTKFAPLEFLSVPISLVSAFAGTYAFQQRAARNRLEMTDERMLSLIGSVAGLLESPEDDEES